MTDLTEIYFKLQYDRIYQHETRRIQFSNLVIVTSSAILTIGTKLDSNQPFLISLIITLVLITINISAIIFITKSREWIKLHQKRAEKILEEYDSNLLNKVVKSIVKPDSSQDFLSLVKIQQYLHASFLLIAFLYQILIYFSCFKLQNCNII